MDVKREDMPSPYLWVVDRGLVGFDAFTTLQPWYFLKGPEIFDVMEKWPAGPGNIVDATMQSYPRPEMSGLLAFARRQDCDDIACFELPSIETPRVILIQGWTRSGEAYDLVASYSNFWDWMKSVIDDIAEWSTREDKL